MWEFPCSNEMYKLEDDSTWKLNVAGRTPYIVRMIVPEGGSTDAPVWVKIHGDHGSTPRLL